MSLITVAALAVALGMDALAVAISVGVVLPKLSLRTVFRLSFHFGLFQFFMPILGWSAAMFIRTWIEAYDHWVALALLSLIGAKMIWESFHTEHSPMDKSDPTRGWSLVMLSVATSIDALAVGMSMAALNVHVVTPAILIGVVAAAMTATGMHLGRKLGQRFGKRTELVGGLILIAIGVKILLEHTLAG